jgi:hypothetical protein
MEFKILATVTLARIVIEHGKDAECDEWIEEFGLFENKLRKAYCHINSYTPFTGEMLHTIIGENKIWANWLAEHNFIELTERTMEEIEQAWRIDDETCPYCNSYSLTTYIDFAEDGEKIQVDYECYDCDRTWTSYYEHAYTDL